MPLTDLQLALGLYIALSTFFFLFGTKLYALSRSLFTGSKQLEGESGRSGAAAGPTKIEHSMDGGGVSVNPSSSPYQKSTNLGYGPSLMASSKSGAKPVSVRSVGGVALTINNSNMSSAPNGKRSSLQGASPASPQRMSGGLPAKAWTPNDGGVASRSNKGENGQGYGGSGSHRGSGQMQADRSSRGASMEGPLLNTISALPSPSGTDGMRGGENGSEQSPVDPIDGAAGASPSVAGQSFIPVTDVPGTPADSSEKLSPTAVPVSLADSVKTAAVASASAGTEVTPPDWNIRLNSIPLPGGGSSGNGSNSDGVSSASNTRVRVGRGSLSIRSGAPVSSENNSSTGNSAGGGGGGTLRQRWTAARAEMTALQTTVTRMKSELERHEKLLARANNKTMTLAFEIETSGEA